MPNLISLEWEKDADGYRIVSRKAKDGGDMEQGDDPEETIEYFLPIGRSTIRYRPLDDHPALFMEFAQLSQSFADFPTSMGVKEFVDKYGLVFPTLPNVKEFVDKYGLLKSSQKPSRVGDVVWESMCMNDAVYWWEKGRETGDLTQCIKEWNKVRMTSIDIRFGKAWDAAHPALFIVPKDLLSAMWLQFAQAVSAMTNLRRCNWCPTWFAYGTGTGRRKSAHFCSDRCRKAAHRHQKEHQR